jgi:RNA polymerase sigma-70 factor, ECF subfamily
VTVRDDLSLLTPRLRRYARALTQSAPGPSESADELVHTTLMRLLGDTPADRKCDLTLTAFALLTQLHRDHSQERKFHTTEAVLSVAAARQGSLPNNRELHCVKSKGLFEGLASLKLDEREALLLVAVEQFTYAQVMLILHVSRASLIARLARARARLQEALAPLRTPDHAARPAPHLRLVK